MSDKLSTAKKFAFAQQSEQKAVKKQAYIDFQNFLKNNEFTHQELRDIFTETHMYILKGFRDKTESVREQAIKFTSFLIIDKLPLNDFYLTYVFPVLVERIGSVELVEESEEIRLLLLQFLETIIIRYSNLQELKPFLNDCVIILSETVKDKYPAIKELSCKCIMSLASALPNDFHLQAESLVKPVLTCFNHQRFKVRTEAIKAIGVIIMHSSYKGLEEVIVPMAQKLFDQIPSVRRTVAQVAAMWSKEYRDRYSFFHKILPLLLTGLNDEITETRIEANELWEQVGLQYLQENEKDVKDQMDFLTENPKYYPKELKRPNLGCRLLVQRNIGKLANALKNELDSWQADVRVRCSQLLCAITLHAEGGITIHLQDLLPGMYSAARDEDKRVTINVFEASKLLGYFVPFETWAKLVLPAIEDSPHFGHLLVLSGLIIGTPQEYICNSLEDVTKILADDSVCYSRKKSYQIEMANCVKAIRDKINENSGKEVEYHLFKITIALIALKAEGNDFNDLNCNLEANDLERLLLEIEPNCDSWTAVTPQRCIFETILLQSREAFGENLLNIKIILVKTLNPDGDAESRLKIFSALSEAFNNKNVIFSKATDSAEFFETLITDIFVPSLVWSAGLTAEAMRTMAAFCLKCALTPTDNVDLFSTKDVFKPLFEKLLPLLLSLVEDASNRSRVLALQNLVLLKEIASSKAMWNTDELVKIYPEILKRFDDPTKQVRMVALEVFPRILINCPDEFKQLHYKAHHELIIDTLLVHFDDDEEEVQNFVYESLQVVGLINSKELSNKLEKCKILLRNQKGISDVSNYLNEISVQ